MKKLITAAAIIASTTANAYYVENLPCSSIALHAEVIMRARQTGVPLSKMLEIARKGNIASLNASSEEMMLDAYGFEVYTFDSVKQKAISGFRDFAERRCLKLEAAAKGGGV